MIDQLLPARRQPQSLARLRVRPEVRGSGVRVRGVVDEAVGARHEWLLALVLVPAVVGAESACEQRVSGIEGGQVIDVAGEFFCVFWLALFA